MKKLRLFENDDWFAVDYLFEEDNVRKCLRLSVDNDYFSFCVFSGKEDLKGAQSIRIDNNTPLYKPLIRLLEDNGFIEICSGTNAEESLLLKKQRDSLELTFILGSEPKSVVSLSFPNVRLASPEVNFSKKSPIVSDFKNKLYSSLLEIKKSVIENQSPVVQKNEKTINK